MDKNEDLMDSGTYTTNVRGIYPGFQRFFSCMRGLRSNDKDLNEQTLESRLKKSLALKVGEWT